jgi:hypothetical protein
LVRSQESGVRSQESEVRSHRGEVVMQKRFKSRFLFCDRWLDRYTIVRNMEAFQDLIVMVLCLALFAVMLIQLWGIIIAIIRLQRIDIQNTICVNSRGIISTTHSLLTRT